MAAVLVTGSSTGIGQATAFHFARRGDEVFASMRNPGAGAALRETAEAESLRLHVIQLDVTDDDSVRQALGEVTARSGRIDVFVNNAGIAGGGGPVEQIKLDEMRAVFETNYFGAVRMVQAVLPGMRERRHGTIINVTSVAGRISVAGGGSYGSSKWALEALSEILATEVYQFGIRVTIVEPGTIWTPLFSKGVAREDILPEYQQFGQRTQAFFAVTLQSPTSAETCAAAIYEAATTKTPRLRWLVGQDAIDLAPGRARLSDEEYIALGRQMSTPEYWAEFERLSGYKLAPPVPATEAAPPV